MYYCPPPGPQRVGVGEWKVKHMTHLLGGRGGPSGRGEHEREQHDA